MLRSKNKNEEVAILQRCFFLKNIVIDPSLKFKFNELQEMQKFSRKNDIFKLDFWTERLTTYRYTKQDYRKDFSRMGWRTVECRYTYAFPPKPYIFSP